MSSVLVTGAAGFIGAHVTHALIQRGEHDVVAVDDLSGGFRENLPESVTFVEASVVDRRAMHELFAKHRFKYVYHLAAYAAEGLSHFIRRFNYQNNLLGSINLINEAVMTECECFVFASSIAVYGAGQVPLREDMTPRPEDPYGVAKYAVELDLSCAHEMFGLDYVIFRPHNVYGEYQNIGDRYRNVVGIFMNQILQSQPMTIFGDGRQQRAFSYIGDIVDPIVRSVEVDRARGRVFNVGADTPYTVSHLAQAVACAMDAPQHPVVHLPERNEVKIAYCDHAELNDVFGSGRQTPLDEGLQRMANWVRYAGARSSAPFDDIEVPRNLPSSWQQ